VAGMKPKIVCTQCGSALTRKDVLCPSCGVEVDWGDTLPAVETVSDKDAPKKEIRENKSQSKNIYAVLSSKSFLGAIAVIALAVIAYALLVEKRPGVDVVQQQASQPMSASTQLPTDIQELENSVAANPDDMSLTLQLANSFHDRLFYEKAIPYYKTYLVMNPKDANARVDMGICYKELGNFTEAENEMKTALHYVPNHLNAHFNLGIVYLSEGNIQESNIWFKRTVALDPSSEVGKRAQQLLTQHNSQSTMQ
jgi:tetratricopeptide (TPR) repeat protein